MYSKQWHTLQQLMKAFVVKTLELGFVLMLHICSISNITYEKVILLQKVPIM